MGYDHYIPLAIQWVGRTPWFCKYKAGAWPSDWCPHHYKIKGTRPFQAWFSLQNQGCTCSCTCSCLPWWFYALHLCGLGYDFVSRIPYKIKGKKTHVLGGPATWFYKGNCHGDRFSLHIIVSSCGWRASSSFNQLRQLAWLQQVRVFERRRHGVT